MRKDLAFCEDTCLEKEKCAAEGEVKKIWSRIATKVGLEVSL